MSAQSTIGNRQLEIGNWQSAIGNWRSAVSFAIRYSTFAILWAVATANAQSGGGYVIKKSTIDGGGGTVTGSGYRLGGTVGQHDAGDPSGGGYKVTGGFWSPATCPTASAPTLAQFDTSASPPVVLGDLKMNRYIGIQAPGSAGRSQAMRVHFKSLPSPWTGWNGTKMWVTAPTSQCELSGVGKNQACPGGSPTFQHAGLTCQSGQAACLDWTMISGGVVYVAHPGLIPKSATGDAEYEIQMVDCSCDLTVESSYSTPKPLLQSKWGDFAGPFDPTGNYYTAQDDRVDIAIDVTAVLNKFRNVPSAPIKARADLEPCVVDLKINITDVTRNLDGFRGIAYPFTPAACGCAVDPCTCPALSEEEAAMGG